MSLHNEEQHFFPPKWGVFALARHSLSCYATNGSGDSVPKVLEIRVFPLMSP